MHAGESVRYIFANEAYSCCSNSLALSTCAIHHADSRMRKKNLDFYSLTLINVSVNLSKRNVASGFEIIAI